MNNHVSLSLACVLFCFAWTTKAAVSPKEITGPNQYSILPTYAENDATNAVVVVRWSPGNRSYCCGTVNFTTADGSAVAGQDYTPVSGSLTFNDPNTRTFNVSLQPKHSAMDRTVKVLLSPAEPNCVLAQSEATLTILAPRPKLNISAGSNKSVRLTWPADSSNYVAEVQTSYDPTSVYWNAIEQTPTLNNGQFVVDYPCDSQTHLFRLRRLE